MNRVTIETRNENQFDLLLRYKSIFCPGCHMIRVKDLRAANPDMQIFESRYGQNFQMLMPVYWQNRRFFLDECLYNYVVYPDSLSRSGEGQIDTALINRGEYQRIIHNTLDRLQMPEQVRKRYKRETTEADALYRFMLGIQYDRPELAVSEYASLGEQDKKRLKIRWLYHVARAGKIGTLHSVQNRIQAVKHSTPLKPLRLLVRRLREL